MSYSGNLNAAITDIRGGMFYVTITYDNGYTIKVGGELMPGATFIAYKSSIKRWEPPYDNEILTPKMKEKLINDVRLEYQTKGGVNIKFE